MFMSLGPNSFIGAGMLIPIIEFAIMYAGQATAKLQRERLKSMEVKARAVKAFDRYVDVSIDCPELVRRIRLLSVFQSYFPQVRSST